MTTIRQSDSVEQLLNFIFKKQLKAQAEIQSERVIKSVQRLPSFGLKSSSKIRIVRTHSTGCGFYALVTDTETVRYEARLQGVVTRLLDSKIRLARNDILRGGGYYLNLNI